VRTQAFIDALPSLWDEDPALADHPRDRRFRRLLDEIGGMATENKLALLNLAASFLEPGEVYLELGTYLGTSAIAAATGNTGEFIAVDDYSQFGGPEQRCRENIARCAPGAVALVSGDAWEFLASLDRSVGVYFYDAGHTFRDQWRAFECIEAHLSEEALIIIDDASYWPVRRASNSFTRYRPQYECVKYFESPFNGEPRWWNGVAVYRYRRCRRRSVPRIVDTMVWTAGLSIAGPLYEFSGQRLVAPSRRAASAIKRRLLCAQGHKG
jgi:predicted O-methyltransferase YrrM